MLNLPRDSASDAKVQGDCATYIAHYYDRVSSPSGLFKFIHFNYRKFGLLLDIDFNQLGRSLKSAQLRYGALRLGV